MASLLLSSPRQTAEQQAPTRRLLVPLKLCFVFSSYNWFSSCLQPPNKKTDHMLHLASQHVLNMRLRCQCHGAARWHRCSQGKMDETRKRLLEKENVREARRV